MWLLSGEGMGRQCSLGSVPCCLPPLPLPLALPCSSLAHKFKTHTPMDVSGRVIKPWTEVLSDESEEELEQDLLPPEATSSKPKAKPKPKETKPASAASSNSKQRAPSVARSEASSSDAPPKKAAKRGTVSDLVRQLK